MMKTVFLLLCVFSAIADESALTYETIDITGFSGEQQSESSSFLEESKLQKVLKEASEKPVEEKQLTETSVVKEQPVIIETEPMAYRPRLTKLDKQKRLRRKLQKYNNLLLQQKIERQRLNVESELGKKVQQMQFEL